nr:HEAT repeat domain-containing protein [Leptospira alstonii]
MSIFLHLTSLQNKNRIFRSGIKTSPVHYENIRRGIFCMPVIPDFSITHQWLREIKRFSNGPVIGVYFRIADSELVWSGKYNEELLSSSAVESFQTLGSIEDPFGFQVILPRKVARKEIVKIKNLPQTIGWRYSPEARKKPRCLCPACIPKGWPFGNKLKENKYYSLISKFNQAQNISDKLSILQSISDLLSFHHRIDDFEPLLRFLNTDVTEIQEQVLRILSSFKSTKLFPILSEYLHSKEELKEAAAESLLRMKGEGARPYLKKFESDSKIDFRLFRLKSILKMCFLNSHLDEFL